MLPDEYPDTKYKLPYESTYRNAYERGWRSSGNGGAYALESADARNESDAWYDGYHDRASSRAKWHSYWCRQAGGCWEHNWV